MTIADEITGIAPDLTTAAIAVDNAYAARNYSPLPVVAASAEGAWITDVDGRRYLDCLAAYSAVNFGHRNPEVIATAHAQLDAVTLVSRAFHSDRLGPFCAALAQLCGKDMVLPMNSGAEAVESGIKVARKWGADVKGVPEGMANIVVAHNNFHGRTISIAISTMNGTTSDSFLAAMSIAVDYVASGSPANSGLTLAKIARAKKLLDEQEVEDGERYFVHAAQQLQDMLLVDKMTSDDYASVKALVDGKIDRFLGFKFIRSERLSRNISTDVRTCFAWHKSGIKFAEGGRNVHMDVLPSKRHCQQIRGVYRCGAVRTQNEKVVRIYTDESP